MYQILFAFRKWAFRYLRKEEKIDDLEDKHSPSEMFRPRCHLNFQNSYGYDVYNFKWSNDIWIINLESTSITKSTFLV